MNMPGPCPNTVRATTLAIALALVPMMALPLPDMAVGATGAAATAQTTQTGAPAATAFRHIPPGPLHGAVGKELAIPVVWDDEIIGDYAVQAELASGPKPKGAAEPADIFADGSSVRVLPHLPGVYVIEVRGIREGPVS